MRAVRCSVGMIAALFVTAAAVVAQPVLPGPPAEGPVAPPWAKTGTRIVYFEGAAEIAKARVKLVPNAKGGWQTPDGRSFKAEEVGGVGGGGYTVIDVGHVGENSSSLMTSSYIFADITRNLVTVSGLPASGGVAPRWTSSPYWRPPAELAQLREGTVGAVTILRMPYALGSRQYDAVRIITETDGGGTVYTYDLDSGLLLFASTATSTAGFVVSPAGTAATYGTASTSLAITKLVSVRDVELPWTNMAAPAWAAQVKSIGVSIARSTAIAGAGAVQEQPVECTIDINAAGKNYVGFEVHTRSQQNTPPLTGATGSGNRLGIFLPPAAMRELRAGQVLDEDQTLGIRLWVSTADARGVTVSEGNNQFRSDVTYDAQGMMVSSTSTYLSGPATITTRSQRTGVR